MALDKNKLKARMQAKSPTQTTPAVPLTNLTKPDKPNGRTTTRSTATPLKGVAKQTRSKDGVKNTERYSFEITHELKEQLERAILETRLGTGKKITASGVIRTALEKYLKAGRLWKRTNELPNY